MDAMLAVMGGLSVDSMFQLVHRSRFDELEAAAGHGLCLFRHLDATAKQAVLAGLLPALVLAFLAVIGVGYRARELCGYFLVRCGQCLRTLIKCCVCCGARRTRDRALEEHGAPLLLADCETMASQSDNEGKSAVKSTCCSSCSCTFRCHRRFNVLEVIDNGADQAPDGSLPALSGTNDVLRPQHLGCDSVDGLPAKNGMCYHTRLGFYIRTLNRRVSVRCFDEDVAADEMAPATRVYIATAQPSRDASSRAESKESVCVAVGGPPTDGTSSGSEGDEPWRSPGECERRVRRYHLDARHLVSGVRVVTQKEHRLLFSRPGDNAKELPLHSRVVVLLVDFLQLVYLRFFAWVIMLLNCVRLPGSHDSFWAPRYRFMDATVSCGRWGWLPYLLTALVVAANLVFAFWFATRTRRRATMSSRGVQRALLSPYKRRYVWWEAALFAQRVVLAALYTLNDAPLARAAAAVLVCAAAWVLHERYRPFRSPTSHRIQRWFLAALFLTAVSEGTSAASPQASTEYVTITTVLNWTAFVLATVLPLVTMLRSYCQRVDVSCGRTSRPHHDETMHHVDPHRQPCSTG
jgi:hypothetical protein